MNTIAIIPARMGSSRFPGKPLAKICGLPMIEHVYRRTAMSKILKKVYVATCDQEIKDAVEDFGGQAIMTKDSHERASDRVAEAMRKAEKDLKKKVDIVVMVQGDEPMVFPQMIDESVKPLLKDKSVFVTNLMGTLKSREEQADPHEIKVVIDKNSDALYFSRAPIPSTVKTTKRVPMYKQVCIIPFRRNFLLKFNAWAQTPLEVAESVDMLRVLENGFKVKMVKSSFDTYSVDTPKDLKKVAGYMKKDKLFLSYAD